MLTWPEILLHQETSHTCGELVQGSNNNRMPLRKPREKPLDQNLAAVLQTTTQPHPSIPNIETHVQNPLVVLKYVSFPYFYQFPENFVQCILLIFSQLPQHLLDLPLLTHSTCVLFFFFSNPSSTVRSALNTWMAFHWSVIDLPGASPLKKIGSPSPNSSQLPKAPQLGVVLLTHIPPPCLGWYLA